MSRSIKKPSQIAEDTYQAFVKFSRLFANHKSYETKAKVTKIYLLILFCLVNAGFMIFNNLFSQLEGSFVKFCQVSVYLNFGCQLGIRGFNQLWRKDEMMWKNIVKKIFVFYKRYEGENGEILLRRSIMIQTITKTFMICYVLMFCIPVITCWILYFATGNYVRISPLRYPFLSDDSFAGYLFNLILASLIIFCVVLSMCGLAYLMAFFGAQVIPMVDILSIKLKQLKIKFEHDKHLISELPRPNKRMTFREQLRLKGIIDDAHDEMHRKAHEGLLEVIEFINDYNAFVADFLHYLNYVFFTAIVTNAISLGLAIIYILTFSIPMGISLCFIYFCDILIPCTVGTIIAHQNDRISNEIWAFPWYELSHSDQKIYLQLIHLCQSLNDIELPMIGHVDMELLGNIIFAAYSYFTFILNFVKI